MVDTGERGIGTVEDSRIVMGGSTTGIDYMLMGRTLHPSPCWG